MDIHLSWSYPFKILTAMTNCHKARDNNMCYVSADELG